jgi:hypothetical protein
MSDEKKSKRGGSIDLRNAQDVIITNSDIAGDVRFADSQRLAMSGNRHGQSAIEHDAELHRQRSANAEPKKGERDIERKTHRWTVAGVVFAAIATAAAVIFGFLELNG